MNLSKSKKADAYWAGAADDALTNLVNDWAWDYATSVIKRGRKKQETLQKIFLQGLFAENFKLGLKDD